MFSAGRVRNRTGFWSMVSVDGQFGGSHYGYALVMLTGSVLRKGFTDCLVVGTVALVIQFGTQSNTACCKHSHSAAHLIGSLCRSVSCRWYSRSRGSRYISSIIAIVFIPMVLACTTTCSRLKESTPRVVVRGSKHPTAPIEIISICHLTLLICHSHWHCWLVVRVSSCSCRDRFLISRRNNDPRSTRNTTK